MNPLPDFPAFSVDDARRALDAARAGDAPRAHINTLEIELLLVASHAQGQGEETGYRSAMQSITALDQARQADPEDQAQALAAAYELTEQALTLAEALTVAA